MNADLLLEELRANLSEHRAREKTRLADYGNRCGMGRCAMSRLNLLDRIESFIADAMIAYEQNEANNDE